MRRLICFVSAVLLSAGSCSAARPDTRWDFREMDNPELKALCERIGGDGCIVRRGEIVHAWGDITAHSDWMSAAKPVFSTLLFFAIRDGLVPDVDARIVDCGVPLKGEDTTMTFRHLGAMTSSYALSDAPGTAHAYNDYGIMLYQSTLFDKVFRREPDSVLYSTSYLGSLGFQDSPRFGDRRRVVASVRDFAKIAWFWKNKGRWDGKQLLPRHFFNDYACVQVPYDLPHAAPAQTNDYLGIGTFGGGADHGTVYGPGCYGFNWWFNQPVPQHNGGLLLPGAPEDLIFAVGVGGHLAAFSFSRDYMLVSSRGSWGSFGAETGPIPAEPIAEFIWIMEKK